MAKQGQTEVEVDAPDREKLGGIVDSVAEHPGLQTKEGADGSPTPSDEWTNQQVTDFYGNRPPTTPTGSPPAAEPTQTAPTEPAEAAVPTEPVTTTQIGDAVPPTIDPNVEALQRELHDLKTKVQERNTENLALKAVNEHMEQFARAVTPQVTPTEPEHIPIEFDNENKPYVSPEALGRVGQAMISKAVQEQVQASLQPLTNAGIAYNRMKKDFPEFATDESKFSGWLDANPTYRERVSSNPSDGMESAYLRYRYEAGQANEQQLAQTVVAGQAVVNEAQRHAAPAGGATGTPTRRTTEVEARTRKLEALRKHGDDTGNWKPYETARLEEAIGTQFLDTMDKTTWGR